MKENNHLQPLLTPLLLWGLGVGYVISGMYFGWNFGLAEGGTLGMAIATLWVVAMYVCFIGCYAELACAIPKAGGVFDYTTQALGAGWGFVAGVAQVIEFVLAPPAIAASIGAHIHLFFPACPPLYAALAAYMMFTLLNILGVKLAATFELMITGVAIVGLLVFAAVALPYWQFSNIMLDAWPNGWAGVWGAIPFAIWFFLGIEGLANAAEESQNPQRDLTQGFASAMGTLVFLCFLTFMTSVGVAGWKAVVFQADGTLSDSPLPLALSSFLDSGHILYIMIVVAGLFGLAASFHGLLMAGGRATFEMGRVGHFPRWLGGVHSKFKTPTNALIINMIVGVALLLSNTAADIIVLAVLGALTLYAFGVISMWQLRRSVPELPRPFVAPAYPWVSFIALLLVVIALAAVVISNPTLAIYYGLTIAVFGGFWRILRLNDKK
ncbi:MAG: ethanolamine permease [Runella sp.]